jgi:DegV family protein with EDD domain
MYTFFTDSDCDLTPEICKEYGFSLISMPYIEKGKEVYPYENWQTFDYRKYYANLRWGDIPSTCAISPAKYISYFEPSFKAGKDILYVHFSAAMSGTFNAMKLALDELYEKYPERKLYSFDTKAITIGSLNLILEMGEKYKKGASIQELIDFGNDQVDKFGIYFYADNLRFFAKSGRVSGLSATMGDLFGIKPLIFMDSDGVMKSISKARGRIGAMEKLLQYIIDLEDHIKDHRVIIAHSDCLHLADKMANMLRQKFGDDLPIIYTVVNPTAGAHCGPDCIGVSFHAKHR